VNTFREILLYHHVIFLSVVIKSLIILQLLHCHLLPTCHWGEVYSVQQYVIKFVGDLRQIHFFFGYSVSSSNNIPTGKVWPMVSIIVLWIWLLFIILNLLSLVLFSIDIKIIIWTAKYIFQNKQCWVQKNVDLQSYFFTTLPFLSENIKLHLISYIYVL
jgi:hypothetical protein